MNSTQTTDPSADPTLLHRRTSSSLAFGWFLALVLIAITASSCASRSADSGSAAAPTTQPTVEPVPDPPTAALDEPFLASQIEDVNLPEDSGTFLVAVLDADGSAVVASKGGDQLGNAPTANDAFRIGSISKVFTSVLTLDLVDEGLVDLASPAADYVTRVEVPSEITVRDLLQHTSGLPNYTDSDVFFGAVGSDNSRSWTPEEIFGHVAGRAPQFEPGSDFGYSNTNYIVLGILVEEVTGGSFVEALQSKIIGPLELENTYLAGFQAGPEPFPGYSGFFTDGLDVITSDYTSVATSAFAAGAMVSSAADLDRFLTALFDGDVISPELLAEMTSTESAYGLGIETLTLDDGRELHGHGGSIMGYNTYVYHEPAADVTGFWVATSDHVRTEPVVNAMAHLLGGSEADVAAAIAADAEDEARDQMAGERVPFLIATDVVFGEHEGVGTFEVEEGSAALGCESGSFVESGGGAGVLAVMTCESGPRSGTFTVEFQPGSPTGPADSEGPWRIDTSDGDFIGLAGSGDFAGYWVDDSSARATFTGEIVVAG